MTKKELFDKTLNTQFNWIFSKIQSRKKRDGFSQTAFYFLGKCENIEPSKNKDFIEGVLLAKQIHDELKFKFAVRFQD